ncbi:CaiB/BaiF CoA transferase family protein [Microbispora sp. CA-102843]|uniref:CaiB/BaiF CoA transferase family protein n=1 Tax=Microbispora sp. CA-102843 TaxID=3239952 RepID=UPI003D9443F6
MATGVLTGIRVVDFGQYVAGPLTALMLADQGADVVHVDPPGGPRVDGAADAALNRGKRRIELDLTDPAGLAFAHRLIEASDVLVENFRPGVMDRLGVGWEAMSARNTGLVYCALPGFAADDPRAHLAGWEGVIAAATGNCRVRNGEGPPGWDDTRPTYSQVPAASTTAASLAAYAVVAALVARHRTGEGQRVEVPLFDAMFELIGGHALHHPGQAPAKEMPLTALGTGTYRCADGRYVQFAPIGTHARFLTWFLTAAGRPDWAAEGLTDEVRLRTEPALLAELRGRLADLFLGRTALEWERIGADAGVPLAMVRTSAEWAGTAHARESGQVVHVDDPMLGPTWLAGPAVVPAGSPGAPAKPRRLGDADHAELEAELARGKGTAAQRPAAHRPDGAALKGIKVVDLTQILAGPTSGRLLADLGADVCKINAPQRRVAAHGYVNRGKRSMLLDIESAAGQRVLWDLLAEADVLIQNFPPGTAERYGIGYEHVRARCPHVVYVSVSCYDATGPWAPRRGYEVQGQAVTGLMHRTGGDRPAVYGPYNLLDYGTGVMAAFAAALGVYGRLGTSTGSHFSASLSRTGAVHQAAVPWTDTENGGPESLGPHPLHRFYEAADGWLFLGAAPADLPRLAEVPGLRSVRDADEAGLGGVLARAFATRPRAEWIEALGRVAIAAHRVVGLKELMADDTVRARGLSVDQELDGVGTMRMPGVAIRLSATPARLGAPAAPPGVDGPAVLAGLGREKDVEDLERAWVLQIGPSASLWP